MARPARERGGREYLRKTPVFDLATRYSDEIAETPFVQRVLRPAARSRPTVRRESPGQSRYKRRQERDRLRRFREAAAFAHEMSWPLNIGITITWTALKTAGERNEGHCLGRNERNRDKYLRDELARLCRAEGLPFAALWARDVGADMGSHIHLAMFWPSYKLAQLVGVIERVSGSSAAYVNPPYTEIEVRGKMKCIVARSVCGGWQIDMNNRKDTKKGSLDWVEYLAGQHDKHPIPPELDGKPFGVSQAIGPTAQKRAQPMLEAREAKYGWMRQKTGESP